VAIAVIGDVDATKGHALGHYVERHTGISRQLVLDLRAVDFFGGQAFAALYYISVHCTRSDMEGDRRRRSGAAAAVDL
jgi:anti-anti-sigma regulatory factor